MKKTSKTSIPKKRKLDANKSVPVDKDNKIVLGKKRLRITSISKKDKKKVLLEVKRNEVTGAKLLVVGENNSGQLGFDPVRVEKIKRPKIINLPHNVISVVSGGMHTVYLSENGEVYTFGCNDEGALGRLTDDDDEMTSATPGRVEIPEPVVQISAGDSHSAALTEIGNVYIWGNFRDSKGQMGLTSNGRQDTPLQILTDKKVVKIASGSDHFVCLTKEGHLYTCGCAECGQLGRVNEYFVDRGGRRGIEYVLNPAQVRVPRNIEFDDVWTAAYATFARDRENGNIFAFGLNNYHQLGFPGNTPLLYFTPNLVRSFSGRKWKEISGGQHHVLALDEEGHVYCIGRPDDGRLGLGEITEDSISPTLIPALENEKCIHISAGECVSYAVTENGNLYSWGFGENYQLGHGNDSDEHTPRQITSVSDGGQLTVSPVFISVSGGGQHTMMLAIVQENS